MSALTGAATADEIAVAIAAASAAVRDVADRTPRLAGPLSDIAEELEVLAHDLADAVMTEGVR